MRRISTDMPNNDMQFYLRRHEQDLSTLQTKMATQKRIKELREDPLAASHAVRYESYLTRLKRFEQNSLASVDHYKVVDGHLRQAVDVLQRIRELAVQGAHGVYTQGDLKNIAVEVNELLKELVQVSNALGPDGKRLFAGDKAFTEPFRIVEGTAPGGGESMIVRVEYQGAGSNRRAEIAENTTINLDIVGGEAFWAERMQIFSSFDATGYRAQAAGAFYVDGYRVEVQPGDTVHAIVAKINESPAPVKAYVDPVTRGLALEGTNPHLIRLEDEQGSRILKDLGILRDTADPGAPNWHPAARVSGGSVFDMVIRLRDALLQGNTDMVGSQGIGGIDLALDNLESRLAELGSRQERSEVTWKRLNEEIPDVTANLARVSSLDFAQAATELSMLDFVHKATLQTAAKITPPTLLDYLR
ncbi:MAG TPA: flagellar hook-associated protein 3 [Termitinemataceae bacterium]|nr:flagellar hook-associated protein 3 [Termitinemataceae bacterium]HOM23569.1 flagellar hook-associated protein 3 [Termitinemataceae bacterium]HPP99850.1 flagellar hook-associated protein 3 [Termitinemataceae bacterium]